VNTKYFFLLILFGYVFSSQAQDRIFKKQGGFIDCNIYNETDSILYYKSGNGAILSSININEVDIIRYQNGKVSNIVHEVPDEYAKDINFKLFQNEYKTDNFLNYINSIARESSDIILRNIPGKIDNSNYNIYFDQISFDENKNELNIPIKISYEKYLSINNGFVKATIIVSSDGKRSIKIINAGLDN